MLCFQQHNKIKYQSKFIQTLLTPIPTYLMPGDFHIDLQL